jgi:ribonuclease HII
MLKPRHTEDARLEVGIDEAGRGCLWGPLVAAAVVWPAEGEWTAEIRDLATQVRDSKKVSAKRRAVMEGRIKAAAVAWGLGRVEPEEIDALGMTRSNRLAFQRALEAVVKNLVVAGGAKPGRILVDGLLGLPQEVLGALVPGAEQVVEPEADGCYLAVAAASIVAKEGRDRMVAEACAADAGLDKRYGLLRSKGYGTARHRAAILEHGMDGWHRRLFLRKLLGLEHTVAEEEGGGGRGGPRHTPIPYSFLEEGDAV